MADTRAFTKYINVRGSNESEDFAVHQTSPAWVLTFVRWQNRDTFRTLGSDDLSTGSLQVRDPEVVENDCLQVTTTVSKGTLTPSMNATLVMTDKNYVASIAPGDFVMVNMLNWEKDARRVADNARAGRAINGENDGFKGVFKVQGVRRIVSVDPNTGTKIVLFKINGYAFTEYNNTIYFNPYLIDPNQDPKNQLLFASYIGRDWANLINSKGLTNVQDVIATLVQSFIGAGITDEGRMEKNGTLKSPNVHFFIPELVGRLLGVRAAKAAKDIYIHLFGIQNYLTGSAQTLAAGMNPNGGNLTQKFNRIYYTQQPCGGDTFLKPEYWNQIKTWAIMNQYTNAPLNEMFTCFRISPEGRVMPTVVFRQIPFTSEDFTGKMPVTRFMNLPRWNIDTALILEQDIGRDEAARINFVQYFGKSTVSVNGADIALEIAKGNYAYDVNDVQRSGLRPYVVTTQFDEPTTNNKEYRSPAWAQVVGDALIGGHLKMNGSIVTAGIVEPIAVGDNLELDRTVYHIEEVSHTASISVQDGRKMFRTSISLSSGVSTLSSSKGTRYAEMDNPGGYERRQQDYNNEAILPGVSENQDTVYRPDTLDGPPAGNAGFAQPNGRNSGDKKPAVKDDRGNK
jgi:hypothetical protein